MKRGILLVLACLALSCTDCGGGQASAPTPAPHASAKPPPSAAPPAATGFSAATIDERIRAEWKKEGIEPGPAASDATYLRRAYLDIIGVIPPPEKVAAFLADSSPDKRKKVVDELLASPRYADHWTNNWDRILLGRQVRGKLVDREAFRTWLHGQFEKNTPYNKFVEGLITATGQNSDAHKPAADDAMAQGSMGMGADRKADAEEEEEAGSGEPVNGAVNWLLKYNQTPADLSGAASRVFLGVQIQCAQCHDHKTEKWTVDDFRSFTACFTQARIKAVDPAKVKGLRRVIVRDVDRPNAASPKRKLTGAREYDNAAPAALDGTDLSGGPSRRKALAAWMTAKENPWFAQAIVNRMWAHFLGRGFVEPVDDLRPTNPGVMPELSQAIAGDFVASGYDLHRLIRLIAATEVYQKAASPPKAGGAPAAKLWSRFRIEPMGTDELLDSIIAATKLEGVIEKAAGASRDEIRSKLDRQVTFLFDIDEDAGEVDEFQGTIPQALFLMNGLLVGAGTSLVPGAALPEIIAMQGGDEAKIRAMYLRTLSREPTAEEVTRLTAFVSAAPPPPGASDRAGEKGKGLPAKGKAGKTAQDPLRRLGRNLPHAPDGDARGQAYEDLFWALLNSSEFVFNH